MSEAALEVRMLTVGEWQENCYLMVEPLTRASLLVDPGAEAGRILQWLADTHVQMILLTHAHSDHVGALAEVRAALGVRVGLHPAEVALAEKNKVAPDFALNDGDIVHLGAHEIQVAYTPGHTPGGVCLRFGARALVGDTIFPSGPGHTNTPAELNQILAALQQTVFTWPDDTLLYPGHGNETTVGRERPGFEAFMAKPRAADLFGDIAW
jgi:hydroxyacylglutathione hydrolase